MATARKKWSTRTTPGASYKRHDSKVAAYRYVEKTAEEFRLGMLRPDLTKVSVFVDEGNGVQLYEVVNLADVPERAS